MGTTDKRERRIRQHRAAVRLEELLAVLRLAGFLCEDRPGSNHWVCRHPSGAWCVVAKAQGRGDSFVLRAYVDRALEAVDQARSAAGDGDD